MKPARRGIIEAAEAQKCRSILDVACGTGDQAIMLANSAITVTGIDLSSAMLEVARRKRPPVVTYVMANARKLPFQSASFDCATVSLALHEMAPESRTETTAEMLRILIPNGKMIVFDYGCPENWKSIFGLALLGFPERIAGGEHFKNFVRFIRSGGIERYMKSFPLKPVETRIFFQGALRLVTLEKV